MFRGIIHLKEKDYHKLTDVQPQHDGVKVVMGPGTGLGEGFLCKSEYAPYYEVYPTEGGHSEYSVRNQEDFELLEHARKFIEHSENIENQRAMGKTYRISIERLCAGPAVPLIYDFMRTKHPDLEKTIEAEGIHFNQMTSPMIIDKALNGKDPLCLKVVDKFTEIFGVEVGNMGLKTLPYGGIYLIGGVTQGISEYLMHSDTFLTSFYSKGRQEKKMRKMPIFLVKPEI
jgi:glucokinase